MKHIPVKNSKRGAIVDDITYSLVANKKWRVGGGGYAIRSICSKRLNGTQKVSSEYMHRIILNAKKGMLVDHINGDRLDNRLSNIRLCSRSENQYNRNVLKKNITGYKGVHYQKRDKNYRAAIGFNYKQKVLGYFKDPKEAAMAYNKAAKKYHGKFAVLNKIEE